MRRDPRSLLELRRLAYRAPRDPGARAVLHDALLETFPDEYEGMIATAHYLVRFVAAYGPAHERFVIFQPDKLRSRFRSLIFSIVQTPFETNRSTSKIEEFLRDVSRWKNPIIVYRTRGYL